MSFFTTTVERRWLVQKIMDNPELYKLLLNVEPDTRHLDEYAHKQLTQKEDDFLTIQIIGPQGSGKSGVGQWCAERWSTIPFQASRISLHYDYFLELIESSTKGSFSILDEQTKIYGVGSNRLKGDIINIIETLRFNGGSIIVISPSEKMLSEQDVHLSIEVLGRDGNICLVAWKARSRAFMGVCKIALSWNNPIWKEYQESKKRYVTDAKARKFHKNDYEGLAAKIKQHKDYHTGMRKYELLLLLEKEVPNLTTEEKKLLVAQIKIGALHAHPKER